MNTKDSIRLVIPLREATRRATDFVFQFILSGGDKTKLEEDLKAIVNAPPPPRAERVNDRQWNKGLEHKTVIQLAKAHLLPDAVVAAAYSFLIKTCSC